MAIQIGRGFEVEIGRWSLLVVAGAASLYVDRRGGSVSIGSREHLWGQQCP